MSDSELSSVLSSPPASEDEKLAPIFLKARGGKKAPKKTKKATGPPPTPPSPPRPKREPSPPHEEVLADNPDIPFIVMFRSRFAAAFPPKVPHIGPQDIERGIVDTPPSPQVENLLCAILALALNRKKPIERGHYGRALEEVISHNKHQWPKSWNYTNPLPGTKTFNDLGPADRLNMIKTLIHWSLTLSDEISRMIKDSYKQSRHEDDLNQPLSVQSWGQDDDKRKYWLIEGQDDTNFRLYREGNRALKNIGWRSMAGSIDEIKLVAEALQEKHHSQAAGRLASRIDAAVPRFEATEEKRRRREYRQIRRAQFSRPEPGFSMYEGRTRGKRMRYTFDDDVDSENFDSDAPSTRRSTRNQSNGSTPAETGPMVTASGRTVRPRGGGMYGESLLSGQTTGLETGSYAASEDSDMANGRATRAANRGSTGAAPNGKRKRNTDYDDGMSEESDAEESGNEWDGGDDFEDDKDELADSADEDDMSVDEEEEDLVKPSLIIKLKVGNKFMGESASAIDVLPIIKPNQDLGEAEEKPPPPEQQAGVGALPGLAEAAESRTLKQEQQVSAQSELMELDSTPTTKQTEPQSPSLEQPTANGNEAISKPLTTHSSVPAPLNGTAGLPTAFNKDTVAQTHIPQTILPAQTHGWS